ncbi:hypothetical protein Tco_0115404 [Tanacetum coccineum]
MVLPGYSCVHRLHSEDFPISLGDDQKSFDDFVSRLTTEASRAILLLFPFAFLKAEIKEDDRSRPRFLSGNNSSERKNYGGLKFRDSIEDEGTIVGGGIGNIIKIFYHGLSEITQEVLNAAAGGIFLYKTPNQAYQLLEDKVLLKLDWAKNQKTKSSLKKTVAFADEGNSNTDTDKIMARMDAMTIKMDAQYKELQSHAKQPTPDLDDDDMPMSHEKEAKFM